jgi:hypothetical protein
MFAFESEQPFSTLVFIFIFLVQFFVVTSQLKYTIVQRTLLLFVIEFSGYWVMNQSCAAGMRINILIHPYQH